MPDVESIAARLYAGPREDFVSARDEAARRAPVELAAEIRALPKPTTAAWLINLVAHRYVEDVRRLVELGGALRAAYESRTGMRELVRQRHEVLRELTGDVRAVARAEGYKLAGPVADQVQETFEAALLDAEIGRSVQAGLLATAAKVPVMVGLPALPARPATPKPKPKPPRAEPKEDRKAAEAARKEALAQARQQLTEARANRRQAEQDLNRTRRTAERAGARVAQLAAELQQAREAEETANQDVADATGKLDRAERAVDEAQQTLDEL